MKTTSKKEILEYDETNYPWQGGAMVPCKSTEENRLAIVAIIEKNKAEKEKNLKSS